MLFRKVNNPEMISYRQTEFQHHCFSTPFSTSLPDSFEDCGHNEPPHGFNTHTHTHTHL